MYRSPMVSASEETRALVALALWHLMLHLCVSAVTAETSSAARKNQEYGMVRSDAHDHPGLSSESLYEIITSWASTANPRLLGGAIALGGALSTVLLLIDRNAWPLVALLVTVGAICAWGLVEQFAPRSHARMVSAAEWVLVSLGSVAALAAALGILFRVMGPAPIL